MLQVHVVCHQSQWNFGKQKNVIVLIFFFFFWISHEMVVFFFFFWRSKILMNTELRRWKERLREQRKRTERIKWEESPIEWEKPRDRKEHDPEVVRKLLFQENDETIKLRWLGGGEEVLEGEYFLNNTSCQSM